jgi:hypothetical protein
MQFLTYREIPHSRVTGYWWYHIRHFGGRKMRFLAERETLGTRVHGFLWKTF